jgi:hypothetical protein
MCKDDPPQGPPPPVCIFMMKDCRLDCRIGRLLGRTVTRRGICRRHGARAGVSLQAVHGDGLLLLAHLAGEAIRPFSHHQVWPAGRQHAYMYSAVAR